MVLPLSWGILGAGGLAGLGSIASSLIGGKKGKTMNLEEMLPSWVRESATGLKNWALPLLSQYQPGQAYTGDFTADMTPFEKLGLEQLSDYLKTPATGELYGAGKEELLKTLGGGYADVQKSPWIQSMMNLSKINLRDMLDQLRAERGSRNQFFTSETGAQELETGQKSVANLDALIGQFIESERGRQYGATGPALAYEEYGAKAPLARVGATQTYGALERLLEQADLEAKYKDYTRQREEMTLPVQVAQGLAGGQQFPSTLQAPGESSTLQNILSVIGKMDWSQLGGLFGGGTKGVTSYGGGAWGSSTPYNPYAYTSSMGRVLTAPAGYSGY